MKRQIREPFEIEFGDEVQPLLSRRSAARSSVSEINFK